MSDILSLSIIIPGFKKTKEEIVLSLIDVDFYLSKLRYSSFEILITGCNKSLDISKVVDSFNKYLPSVFEVSTQDVLKKISGEKVFVFNPGDEICFEDFAKITDISKSSCDLAFFKNVSNHGIFDKITFIFKKIFRIKKNIDVVSNIGVAYFKFSSIRDLSFFNFSKSAIFGFLNGMNVKVLKKENDNFKVVFLDYLNVWVIMFLYSLRKIIKKIWKR